MIITIDGPTASGKSSVARLLAQEMGFFYICSGFLYRGFAYALIADGLFDPYNPVEPSQELLEKTYKRCAYTFDTHEHIILDGKDISASLKEPLLDRASSVLSTYGSVRDLMNRWQHELAKRRDVIIEGRDSGTVVFPSATFKFFLTADETVRASRWAAMQYAKSRKKYTLEQARTILKERDARDSTRSLAPLKIAAEGIVLDTTNLSLSQVVASLKAYVQH